MTYWVLAGLLAIGAAFAVGIVAGMKSWFPVPCIESVLSRIRSRKEWRKGIRAADGDRRAPSEFDYRILAIGHSHTANTGQVRGPATAAYDISLENGVLTRLKDPVLNAPGKGGSVWTRLAARMLSRNPDARILFCTVGVPGSSILKWIPGGTLQPRINLALETLPAPPTHVFVWVGEKNAEEGMAQEAFESALTDLVDFIRKLGVTAPIVIAQSSFIQGETTAAIRNAQKNVAEQTALLGPDMDTIGLEHRYDGIHFTDSGLEAAAERWDEVMRRYA